MIGALRIAALAAAVALTACAPAPVPERVPDTEAAQAPPGFPADDYRRAQAQGEAVYAVDTEASELVVHAYRGGRLARFGHNHTVASRALRGLALRSEPLAGSRFDVYLPVEALIVDDPADRARAGEGFEKPPSESAIEGTRKNLLGERVLDATEHPFIEIAGRVIDGGAAGPSLLLQLTVRGQTVGRRVVTGLELDARRVVVSGELRVAQSELGIEPYSALGGALLVEDELRIRYRIVARRLEGRR